MKKTLGGLGVGALLTTFGVLGGVGALAVAGVVIQAASLVKPAQDHADVVAEVEQSDMYFLWRTETHLPNVS